MSNSFLRKTIYNRQFPCYNKIINNWRYYIKASTFVNTVQEYINKHAKEYDLTNHMCYPYHDQYGFIDVKGLKTQIIIIPEKCESLTDIHRIDEFPEKRLKLNTILERIRKEIEQNGDRDLYYKTFEGKKELVNHWQTTYNMIVPMYLEDINE